MSKSILQEVATLNAELFNEAKLKANLNTIKGDIEQFKQDSNELINDLNDKYEIVVSKLLEETVTINEQLRAEMLKVQIDILSTTTFCLDEFSKNFFEKGAMRKQYLRDNVQTNDRINHLHLKPLEYYTGPIKSINLDGENNFRDYGEDIPETNRGWMYIQDKIIKYRGYTIFTLSGDEKTITLGNSFTDQVYLPGDLTVENDITVNDGQLFITSSSTADDSIRVNGNIISTAGHLSVYSGLSTTMGDIITSSGNLITEDGGVSATTDITTSGGNIEAPGGGMTALTGYVTATGGYVCTSSGSFTTPSGDFTSDNGEVRVTKGFTTTGGNITITNASGSKGNITTNHGNIKTTDGNISTGDGNISTGDGNISSTHGNLILQDGDIIMSDGDINVSDGKLNVSDDSSFSKDLLVGEDLDVNGELSVGGEGATISGPLTSTGKFVNTYTGSPVSQFSGGLYIGGSLQVHSNLSVDGALNVGNLRVGGTLKVDGFTNFYADVDASGRTITAKLFDGEATSARYADVAEKYESDKNYPAGTVVSVGKTTEITLYNPDLPLAGVISTNPGYLLNAGDETSEYSVVALTGRIPVMTNMYIERGMYILPDENELGKCIGVLYCDLPLGYQLKLIGVAVGDTENGKVEVKV